MTARNRDPDRAAEQWLADIRTEQHDGLTFQGASDIGVMDEPVPPWRPDGERFADPRTWDKRPDALSDPAPPPPLPAHWDPEPVGRTLGSWWDRYTSISCEYNAADHDTPIPCGNQHRGDWKTAQAAGWHLDTYGRRACPDCQMTPEYRTLYPLAIWAAHAGGNIGAAEQELIEDVLDTARRGRHRRTEMTR